MTFPKPTYREQDPVSVGEVLKAGVLEFSCTTCGAAPGFPCRDAQGCPVSLHHTRLLDYVCHRVSQPSPAEVNS